jgi:site-specific recombinase XerD
MAVFMFSTGIENSAPTIPGGRTREGLGKDVNPHLFRDAAATLLAIADPVHVRLATPLLGHRNLSTTEAHYQQAQSLSAHRKFRDVVGRRRATKR